MGTGDKVKISNEDLMNVAKQIKLVIMDVDGVLTDGNLYYLEVANQDVKEFKSFNSLDGMGLHLLRLAGIGTGVISGGNSLAVNYRAKVLGMKYVYQGTLHKESAFKEILDDASLSASEVAYMGDDLSDIPLLKACGLKIAVANAINEVKDVANYVTLKNGGNGAVREVCEFILKSQGIWSKTIATFVGSA